MLLDLNKMKMMIGLCVHGDSAEPYGSTRSIAELAC